MNIVSYTAERAVTLRRLSVPEVGGLRFLWLEFLSERELEGGMKHLSHAHGFYEVHFMLSGRVRYTVGEKVLSAAAGDALFLPPAVPHKYLDSAGEPLKMTIAFSFDGTGGSSFLDAAEAGVVLLGEALGGYADALLRLGERRDVFAPHLIGGKMLEVLLMLFDAMALTPPARPQTNEDARLTTAKEFIEQNIHRPLGCEDVAGACFLSSKQLGRLFQKEMGCSLSDYITAQKLSYARRLLRMSERSIKEIGLLLGFENESGFTSFFKRHTGVAPGVYRKEAK